MVGSVSISTQDVFASLLGRQTTPSSQIVQDLRLPRALGAFSCGALLALAGVLMQVLLRNPLADPYVLGISGGAAVAALLAILAGASGWLLTGSAFAGSLLSMFIVFGLAQARGSWSPTRLLLTGVVVAAGWGALVSFILAIAPAKNLHSMLFWLMGDLGYVNTVWPGITVMTLGLIAAMLAARRLNILLHGPLQANALGVDVGKLRLMIYLLASLMTATAVTIAGSIGFAGLIVPHLIRLLGITDHRWLLPGSALLGGSLLVIADTFARTIMAPQQLPVGVIMAMIGVPLFLYLLHRSNKPL
ncbi:MAG: iron ABC transporter permease [Gammaproteobacteria bacterium]|nr:iron ABC transporter permease [Gammaproteobacteria bacterium]